MIVKHDSVEPVSFDGLKIHDYTAGQDVGSSLAVIKVPPGVRHRRAYSTRSDKYYYVLAGRIRFTLNGDEHDLVRGDFCLIPRNQHFCYENRTPRTAVLILVHTPSFDLQSEVFVEDN